MATCADLTTSSLDQEPIGQAFDLQWTFGTESSVDPLVVPTATSSGLSVDKIQQKSTSLMEENSKIKSVSSITQEFGELDRALSISLEELMENIKVPQNDSESNLNQFLDNFYPDFTDSNINHDEFGIEFPQNSCQTEDLGEKDHKSANLRDSNTFAKSSAIIHEKCNILDSASSADGDEVLKIEEFFWGEEENEQVSHKVDCRAEQSFSEIQFDFDAKAEYKKGPMDGSEMLNQSRSKEEPWEPVGDEWMGAFRTSEGDTDSDPIKFDLLLGANGMEQSDFPEIIDCPKLQNSNEKPSHKVNDIQCTAEGRPVSLDLSLEYNGQDGSCRTPEYCRELSFLSLGVASGNDLEAVEGHGKETVVDGLEGEDSFVKLSRPRRAKEIHQRILYSGVMTFPGCFDVSRRPVIFMNGDVVVSHNLGKLEIARLMLYLASSASYITLVVDLRKFIAWKVIKESTLLFQWNRPGIISRIIFISEDPKFHPDEDVFKAQCNIVHDEKELQQFVDADNLPEGLGGNFFYRHREWIEQRLELESYVLLCERLQHNFASNTVSMTTASMPTTLQGTADMLNRHRSTMTELLDDKRVRDLHDTGHRFLTDLKRDEKSENQLYTDQIHSSYETVCSAIQRYVQVADERLLALERHLLVKQFEESCDRILSWASDRRSELHQKFGEVADSLNDLRKQRIEFDRFYLDVVKQYAQCDCLLTEANQLSSSGFLGKVNSHAQHAAEKISQVVKDMEMKKEEVETASQLYLFVDQAYSWALTGMKFVASLNMNDCLSIEACQEQIDKYDEYMASHPPIPNERFNDMREIAVRYKNVKCQRQCEVAQQKCNETKELFKKRRRLLVKARDHQITELKKKNCDEAEPANEDMIQQSTESETTTSEEPICDTPTDKPSRPLLRQNSDISYKTRPLVGTNNNNNGAIPSIDDSNELTDTPVSGVTPKHRPKKMLRKSASMSSHHSTTQRLKIGLPMRSLEPDTKGRTKWSLAIEELIQTEEEYVDSLEYIIEHYYPLMIQIDDVPQPLRGKRGVIFGNIENIRDFHAGQFLESLQGCLNDPGRVAEVFIQHRDSFSMYALYSKNKPRSDELMREHGAKFFRAKQHQLRDKMDLASYLLKPVQRMGKYALLLHNIGKHSDIRYRSLLKEAESLVKFQLRHGNDLLAMDSIVNCDVNLKEQGELKRQDEFLIFRGRRKYLRHVFLFDDLMLLSKPQRVHGGHDLYHYKSSYKTAEIGLTENIGETGLKFEIWFRRPMQDNIVFHATTDQRKQAWVDDVRGILWRQAMRNKENRRSEMVSMGVGSKPHLDIRSSQSPITDRSVAAGRLMGGRVLSSRSRASIAVATFDHACKRPHSTVSTSSTSSNGSFQLTHQPASMFDFRAIVEGDEFESGSGRGSSLCTSSGDIDPLEGTETPKDARPPQQYVTTV